MLKQAEADMAWILEKVRPIVNAVVHARLKLLPSPGGTLLLHFSFLGMVEP